MTLMTLMPTLSDASVVDLLLDMVCVVDEEGTFVFVSAACQAVLGYAPQELVGRRMIDLVAPEDRERTLEAASRIMAGGSHLHFENRYIRKDGQLVDIMWSARWSSTDRFRVAVGRDVTQRKRAESMQAATYGISEAAHTAPDMESLLADVHRITRSLLPHRGLAIALVGEGSGELAFTHRVEHSQERVACAELDAAERAFCEEVIAQGGVQMAAFTPSDRLLCQPVSRCSERVSWLGMPLQSQKGTIGAVILERHPLDAAYSESDKGLLQYISTQMASVIERKRLYDRLQHMAQFDALTDLPNRACLEDRLQTAIARVRREGRALCLLYLDLDHFKQVNDTHGHAVGDSLLRDFARRLKACVRESDTVARMSGDEFVVLLESQLKSDGNEVVTRKIQAEFELPFLLGAHRFHIRPSIGVAHYPEDGADAEQLFRHADDAMYVVKNSRR